MAQKASIYIQLFCKRFLGISILNAELANAFSALFYIISHMYDLQSQNYCACGLRLEVTGILLCMDSTAGK